MDEKKLPDGKARRIANLRPAKKGEIRNPHGRTPNPLDRAIRNLSLKEYRRVIEMVMIGNLEDLKAVVNDPKSSALTVGLAKALVSAINKGDVDSIDKLASRIIGKMPDKFEITGEDGGPIQSQNTQYVVVLPAKKEIK